MPNNYAPIVVDKIIGNPLVTSFEKDSSTQTQMPITDLHRHWDFLMTGTVTLAGYTTAPTIYSEAPENIMGLISLVPAAKNRGGISEQFKAVDAAYLRFRTLLEQSGVDVDRTLPSSGSNGAYSISTSPRMYFSRPLPNNQWDDSTAMDARNLSSLNLNIQWRDNTAVTTGGAGGTTTLGSNVQVTVKARVLMNVSPLGANGQVLPRKYEREIQQTQTVPGTQLSYVFSNLRNYAPLRALYIKTTVGSVPFAEVSDLPLGGNQTRPEGPHVQLRLNQTQYLLDAVYKQIQLQNRKDFGVVNTWLPGHLVYVPSTPIDLRNYAAFDMVADTEAQASAQNTVQFTYRETGWTNK